MKKTLLSTMIAMMAFIQIQAQITDTIKVEGFSYVPAELTVNVGDTVVFMGNDFHPLTEVSEATWTNNEATPLEGGFDLPAGNGKVTFESAGIHYYVCTAHIESNQMKGMITVVSPTTLPDVSGNESFSVYPIPLTGSALHITFKNQLQKSIAISVYDLAGNLRISSNGSTSNGHYAVDCSDLPKGLFLLKLSTDEGENYTKFVKQ